MITSKKKLIDSDSLLHRMRKRIVNLEGEKLLISDLRNTAEENDPYTILNCGGFGRIRKFQNYGFHGISDDFAYKSRNKKMLLSNYPSLPVTRTQVFQIAGCTWRCWYCYVDERLLAGNLKYAKWFTADSLLNMMFSEPDPPDIIDLSGGQPDLVPEWPIWILEALQEKYSDRKTWVRSEDNLSNFLLTDILTDSELDSLASCTRYTRIGCFKGFDEDSFSFNTGSPPRMFNRQFEVTRSILQAGIDFYAHVTLCGNDQRNIKGKIATFIDKLQLIHCDLPLRVIPLTIKPFSALQRRSATSDNTHIGNVENIALDEWFYQLSSRFTHQQLSRPLDKTLLAKPY